MQVVLVYVPPFSRNSLLKCASVQNREKFTKTPYFGGSRSFKVIDFHISKKLVTSACYDKQHMSAPICNHFHGRRANSGKNNVFLGWMLIFSLFSFAETS